MTLTITISLGNFCSYRCSYCVARSNDPCWDPPADWSSVPAEDLLDVSALARWLQWFTPEAVLHISGGEPLTRPDVENCLAQLCKRHRVRLYTNGALIKQRPRLLSLPLTWVATWHPTQIGLGRFCRQVAPLEGHPVIGRVVLREGDDPNAADRLKERLPWLLVSHVQWDRNPSKTWRGFGPNRGDDIDHVASQQIHLVVPRNGGEVWACNSCAASCGPIGNIEAGWYRPQAAADMDRKAKDCVINNRCAAFQDAVLLDRWFGGEL
jgi:hypothetical protein